MYYRHLNNGKFQLVFTKSHCKRSYGHNHRSSNESCKHAHGSSPFSTRYQTSLSCHEQPCQTMYIRNCIQKLWKVLQIGPRNTLPESQYRPIKDLMFMRYALKGEGSPCEVDLRHTFGNSFERNRKQMGNQWHIFVRVGITYQGRTYRVQGPCSEWSPKMLARWGAYENVSWSVNHQPTCLWNTQFILIPFLLSRQHFQTNSITCGTWMNWSAAQAQYAGT